MSEHSSSSLLVWSALAKARHANCPDHKAYLLSDNTPHSPISTTTTTPSTPPSYKPQLLPTSSTDLLRLMKNGTATDVEFVNVHRPCHARFQHTNSSCLFPSSPCRPHESTTYPSCDSRKNRFTEAIYNLPSSPPMIPRDEHEDYYDPVEDVEDHFTPSDGGQLALARLSSPVRSTFAIPSSSSSDTGLLTTTETRQFIRDCLGSDGDSLLASSSGARLHTHTDRRPSFHPVLYTHSRCRSRDCRLGLNTASLSSEKQEIRAVSERDPTGRNAAPFSSDRQASPEMCTPSKSSLEIRGSSENDSVVRQKSLSRNIEAANTSLGPGPGTVAKSHLASSPVPDSTATSIHNPSTPSVFSKNLLGTQTSALDTLVDIALSSPIPVRTRESDQRPTTGQKTIPPSFRASQNCATVTDIPRTREFISETDSLRSRSPTPYTKSPARTRSYRTVVNGNSPITPTPTVKSATLFSQVSRIQEAEYSSLFSLFPPRSSSLSSVPKSFGSSSPQILAESPQPDQDTSSSESLESRRDLGPRRRRKTRKIVHTSTLDESSDEFIPEQQLNRRSSRRATKRRDGHQVTTRRRKTSTPVLVPSSATVSASASPPPQYNAGRPTVTTQRRDGRVPNPPRFPGDQYTSRFVRGIGATKEALCPICEPEEVWLKTKISAYWYHMHFLHGISQVTGAPFRTPLRERTALRKGPLKPDLSSSYIRQGLCHRCENWVELEGPPGVRVNTPEIYWWKHCQRCHR